MAGGERALVAFTTDFEAVHRPNPEVAGPSVG
jgi:hypothetical protein